MVLFVEDFDVGVMVVVTRVDADVTAAGVTSSGVAGTFVLVLLALFVFCTVDSVGCGWCRWVDLSCRFVFSILVLVSATATPSAGTRRGVTFVKACGFVGILVRCVVLAFSVSVLLRVWCLPITATAAAAAAAAADEEGGGSTGSGRVFL